MNSRVLASIFVVAGALIPANGANTPFRLTLEAEQNPIKAGSEVKVDITLRNSSNHAIAVGLGLAEMDYALGVRDSQNRIPPETDFARKSKGRGYFSSETVFTLQPGETLPKQMLVISKFYDLSRPGRYTIQVSRTVPKELGGGTVKSDAITITIAGLISAGPRSGQPNRELKMNVRLDAAAAGESNVPKFRVELQNTGDDDLILNLGITLADGRKQYPKDIVLLLTDSQGKARRFELREPTYVAGRVDPLIVPLPVGSTFSIPVDLEKYWAAASNEFAYKLKPGTYLLEAQFSGRGLTQQEANLDVKGLALMPYWTGSITSNRLQFEFSGQ